MQQALVEAALEPSREAGTCHSGCGVDVATLLALLAAALRKGQWQCYLPSSIGNPDLEAFLGHARATALVFPGAASHRYAACASNQSAGAQNAVPATIPVTFPSNQARQRATCSQSLAVLATSFLLSGQLWWQEVVGAHCQARPQGAQVVSQQQHQQQHTRSILDVPKAQSTPTLPQSASPGTARFFVSSPAVAMPIELWASTGTTGAPDGGTEHANMGGIFGDEELEREFESIDGGGWKASRERRCPCCSKRPKGGWQDGPSPDPCPAQAPKRTRGRSGLAGPSTPLNIAPSRNGYQKACNACFSWLRNRTCPRRRRAVREVRRSWLQRRCGMAWRRRTVVLATGTSRCARGACLRSTTVALCQADH